VKKNDLLAYIHDPFLINQSINVIAPFDGIVIGQTLKPLISEGDALYHIASFKKIAGVSAYIEDYGDEITNGQH
jgi:predicted deacylase